MMMKKGMFKSWRIGDYLRQFSIVTAGVMVTFIGSSIISNYSTQREIKSSMQLVINELEKNKESIGLVKDRYMTDRIMSSYIIDSSFVIEKFSIDTLKKYNRLVSNISAFFYSDDALEVLKNSSLMQKIDDKNLLLNVIEAYKSLYETQQSVKEYYTMKSSTIVGISMQNDVRDNYGSIYATWKMLFSHNSMRSFCVMSHRFFNDDYFNDVEKKLDETINLLKKNYK